MAVDRAAEAIARVPAIPRAILNAFVLRRSWIWLLVGVALAYGLRLNSPETGQLADGTVLYSYDENYTVRTAKKLADGDMSPWDDWRHPRQTLDEWMHPPTPRVVVASILRHFGLNPVAYRAPSVLLGMLVVAMVWVIGNRMRGPGLGLFAAILTASDGWIFTLSRVAMTDIYLISMVVAAYAVLYVWWTATSHRNAWMLLLGATCGMAVSMKWSAVPPLLGLVPLVVSRFVVDWRRSPGTRARTQIDAAIAVVSLTVVPAWIYVTSFLPFFAAGNSLTELVGMHRAILEYNRTFPVTARDGTRWYSWPLDRGFTWFVTRSDDHVTCWYSLPSGNWFVWLPFLPTMAYAVARFVRRPQFERAFVVVAGMAMWLPYGLVRRVEYTRYFALAIPFSALAVSMALFDLCEWRPRFGRPVRAAYLAGALAFFVLRYPVWAGVTMPCQCFDGWHWKFWLQLFSWGKAPV